MVVCLLAFHLLFMIEVEFYIINRFRKDDIHLLMDCLHIPEFYICQNGTVAGGLESFLLLLRRFAYPNRLSDLCSLFGRPEPELSMIIHKVYSKIHLYIQKIIHLHYPYLYIFLFSAKCLVTLYKSLIIIVINNNFFCAICIRADFFNKILDMAYSMENCFNLASRYWMTFMTGSTTC